LRFLKAQTKLEDLSLKSLSDFYIVNHKPSLRNFRFGRMNFFENDRFVMKMKAPRSIYDPKAIDYLLYNNHDLKKIALNAEFLPPGFNKDLPRNESLIDLTLFGATQQKAKEVSCFLRRHPNIERLNMIHFSGISLNDKVFWDSLSRTLRNLQSLSLYYLDGTILLNLKLRNLTSLSAIYINGINASQWECFGQNNPKIKKLHYHRSELNQSVIKNCMPMLVEVAQKQLLGGEEE